MAKKGTSGQVALVEQAAGGDPALERHLELAYLKKGRAVHLPAPLAPISDTHAHLMSFWRVDPVFALARAARAGVKRLVSIWDPLADARTAPAAADFHALLEGWLAAADDVLRPSDEGSLPGPSRGERELFDHVGYLAGVHPYGAPRYTDEVHEQVLEALEDPLCLGVGEIGLDYHFDAEDDIEAAPHDVQMSCMARQLAVAVERDLPVELHLRNDPADDARAAHADAYRVLQEVGVPKAGCVLHCFGEDRATMERFVELGCSIAFGGAATFKGNEEVREAFAAAPLDRIVFETDCPYMAPEPIRGLECEPAMIVLTQEALCRDRAERTGEDPVAIARSAWENSLRLFG